jgi:hypothetical protein
VVSECIERKAGMRLTQGHGDDVRRRLRSVEGLGEGGVAVEETDEGVVSGLDREDGSGSEEVARGGEGSSSSEVRGNSDTLNDLGQGEESRDAGVGEGVVAGADGGHTGGGERGREESDVRRLVLGDLLEEGVRAGESSGGEVGSAELGERLGVEGV